MYKIYNLSFNDEIKYIGFTYKDLSKRLQEHIYDAKYRKKRTHKRNWILKLIEENNLPTINLIEYASNIEQAKEKEIEWISKYKLMGVCLTNLTNGGDGISGYKHSLESIEKTRVGNLGKKVIHTEETKNKISETLKKKYIQGMPHPRKGKKMSEHTKLKISNSNRGKSRNKGNVMSQEVRDKMISNHSRSIKIIQYDLNMNQIKVWPSYYRVKVELGFEKYKIKACILGKKDEAYGFIWRTLN